MSADNGAQPPQTERVKCSICDFRIDKPKNVDLPCPTCGWGVAWVRAFKLKPSNRPEPTHPSGRSRTERKRDFLVQLKKRGNITAAAEAAQVSVGSVYKWLKNSPTFKKKFELAMSIATDKLEIEARRRAVEGVAKPVGFHKGVPGAIVREYSDKLLDRLLQAHRPEKFGQQNQVNIQLFLKNLDLSRCTPDQIERLAAGEHPAIVFNLVSPEHPALPPGRDLDAAQEQPG